MHVAQVTAHETSSGHSKALDGKAFLQPRLEIGPVDDPMEREADTMADRVMRMPLNGAAFSGVSMQSVPMVQRKCDHCEKEEEEGKVQRKAANTTGTNTATQGLTQQIHATRGGGQSLDGRARQAMESGFGRDFSNVRIHTGGYATEMNRDLQAHAFTVGRDIYFNAGRFAPESPEGRHLLAHELTHVVQQSQGLLIQRACDTVAYDARMTAIRAMPLFNSIPAHADPRRLTPAQARTMAEGIMTDARARDNCMYYADGLHLLFSTAEAPPSSIAAAFGPAMATAAANEGTRLGTAYGGANRLFEENLSGDPTRVFENIATRGKRYQIDRRDPANVVIRIKVFPTGDPTAVGHLTATEDAIEKKASVLGYTVDLDFVTAAGPDVYEVGVNPGAWPDAGNWVLGPEVSAHELHHLMDLPDRYNYIDRHAGNDRMWIVDRVRWFNEEFRNSHSALEHVSFMGRANLVHDQDICDAMHAPDMAACLASRLAVRQPGIDARNATHTRVLRIIEILENTGTTAAERSGVVAQGNSAMGTNFVEATVIAQLRSLAGCMSAAHIQMENRSGIECETASIAKMTTPNGYIICPAFSTLSAAAKAREFVRIGAELCTIAPALASQLGAFIEAVFNPAAAQQPAQPAQPAQSGARQFPTTLMLGAGAGTTSLALFELQQRIHTFAPGGRLTIPIPLQLQFGIYGLPDLGSAGGAVGLGTDFRLATFPPATPGSFGINAGGGVTAGATGIGTPTGSQAELGAYGRAGVYVDSSQFRVTPQYQFNYLRNIGAGTDAQIHTFLVQLGYSF